MCILTGYWLQRGDRIGNRAGQRRRGAVLHLFDCAGYPNGRDYVTAPQRLGVASGAPLKLELPMRRPCFQPSTAAAKVLPGRKFRYGSAERAISLVTGM